ncbi:peptide deformylase [Sphingobacteriales bacterium UPWRP_1]|nr:peptide deformylase [Sphingobacteriales bacterium TSM_CSM]PSJ75177.1 peptide deformylase [Sphingobacteriales bacterium UPWRP_1]
MILPIVAYGDAVLRKTGEEIAPGYPDLQALIANMFETMYNARGVGLAAPQVGLSVRLFIVDTLQLKNDEDDMDDEGMKNTQPIKKVFINARILEQNGKMLQYNEGCLSIPTVREDVKRKETVTIRYCDEQFNYTEETYEGLTARVILHEYDHIEGILFTDHLSPIKKQLLKKRLERISKGQVEAEYRMRFPLMGKKR